MPSQAVRPAQPPVTEEEWPEVTEIPWPRLFEHLNFFEILCDRVLTGCLLQDHRIYFVCVRKIVHTPLL